MKKNHNENEKWGSLEKAQFIAERPRVQDVLRVPREKWTILVCLAKGNKTDRLIAAILMKKFGNQFFYTKAKWEIEFVDALPIELVRMSPLSCLNQGIIPLGVHDYGVFGRRSGTDISLTEKMIHLIPIEALAEKKIYFPLGTLMTEVLLERPHSGGEPHFWQLAELLERAGIDLQGQLQRMEEIINGWIQRQKQFFTEDLGTELSKFGEKTVVRGDRKLKVVHGSSQNRRIASRILQGTTKFGKVDVVIVEDSGKRLAALTMRHTSLKKTAPELRTKISPRMNLDELKESLNRMGGGPLLGVDWEESDDGNERIVIDIAFFNGPNCKWLNHEQVANIVCETVELK